MDRLYAITKRGMKYSGDISANRNSDMEVLDAMHGMGALDIDSIANSARMPRTRVSNILRKLEHNGLVENLSKTRV